MHFPQPPAQHLELILLGYYACPQQPPLSALSISTPSPPSVPFSFSSFVEACVYFQRLLYSAFYVQCFKSFDSPEHSQLSVLSQGGRWIFLEVIIQGKKTRPPYLIDFTSHLNERYVGTTSKCLWKWLIWSFLFSDSGRTKKKKITKCVAEQSRKNYVLSFEIILNDNINPVEILLGYYSIYHEFIMSYIIRMKGKEMSEYIMMLKLQQFLFKQSHY